MRFEGGRPHMKEFLGHRAVGPLVRSQAVIAEHSNAGKSSATERAVIVPGTQERALREMPERCVHDRFVTMTPHCSRLRAFLRRACTGTNREEVSDDVRRVQRK